MMEQQYVPAEEIETRLQTLRSEMAKREWDAALIVHNVDLVYFSGTMQNALLFVPQDGKEILMVKKYVERAERESAIAQVTPLKSLNDMPSLIEKQYGRIPQKMGIELDVLPANEYLRLQEIFSGVEIVDSSSLVKEIRKIKSAYEIELMKQAGEIGKIVYDEVPRVLKEGMTEIELAGILVAVSMRHGHQNYLRMRAFNSYAYSWHVLSGYTGSILSYIDAPMGGMGLSPAFPVGASHKPIKAHEPILIDFGICYYGYQIDETRMFSVGELSKRFKDAYRATRDIEAAMTTAARPGVSCHEIYRMGWEVARKLGYEEQFMGPPDYKTRFIGHGIGLEIDEYPFIAQNHDYPLEEGMTFALEPKMVFPGEGAVGIENTFAVGNDGVEKLTPAEETLIEV
ncbi:MAG: Xaa-Pro peptidase family protein [Deltaproteobacteria bacterium]